MSEASGEVCQLGSALMKVCAGHPSSEVYSALVNVLAYCILLESKNEEELNERVGEVGESVSACAEENKQFLNAKSVAVIEAGFDG